VKTPAAAQYEIIHFKKSRSIKPTSVKYLNFFIGCILLITNPLWSQSPVVEWQKLLGGNNGEYPNSIEHTSDGGFIVAGFTEGPDNGDITGYHGNPLAGDLWVIKSDNAGNVQWKRCFGGFSQEVGGYIKQLPDGGYVLAGSSASVSCQTGGPHGGLDFWIVRLTNSGNIIWQKWFGGSQNEYCCSLDLTADGGFLIAGETESSNGDVSGYHNSQDYWIIKVDNNGNLVWQKCLGGSNDEICFSVRSTNDGGCIATGHSFSNDGDVSGNKGSSDYWLVKLSNTGSLQWQKCLGGTQSDQARSIVLTVDGGYIVAGMSSSNNNDVSGNHSGPAGGSSDFWVVKINSVGVIQWQKCYGGAANEIAYEIKATPDGGFAVAGTSESNDGDLICNAGWIDLWAIKINSSGLLEWQKSLGGSIFDGAYCLDVLNDGSIILGGSTCSSQIPGYHPQSGMGTCNDFWIVKLSTPVSIIPAPIVSISPTVVQLCNGGSATLTAKTIYGGDKAIYQWTKNGIPVGNNNPYYTSSNFVNNDVITCTVTHNESCLSGSATGSASITLAVNNSVINPQITIAADNSLLCQCSSSTFTASVSNGGNQPVYQWKKNGLNVGANANVYEGNLLQNGDVVSCIFGDVSGCVINGSVISNSIQVNTTNLSPAVSIVSSADTICEGSEITFTATAQNAGTNPLYQWKLNGINVGTNSNTYLNSQWTEGDMISCVITANPALSCSMSTTAVSNPIKITVKSKQPPSVNITTPSQIICTGSAVTFTATTINAGNFPSYQWQLNGNNTGSNSNTYSNSFLADGDVVSCLITTDPSYTCVGISNATSNQIIMSVANTLQPTINISISANDICERTQVTFRANIQNAGANVSYVWKVNSANAGSNINSFVSNNLKNGDQVYCILNPVGTSCATGPVSSNIITMSVNALPVLSIMPADTLVYSGSSVQLNASSSVNLVSYSWSPSNLLQSTTTLFPKTVPLANNTLFTLQGTTNKGCIGTVTASVKIFKPFFMPSAFTPNNDGLNDLFRIPPNVSLKLTEFSVYDRWGNKIFTTGDISKGWDGTYKGVKLSSTVFVYIVNGSNEKGPVFKKGTVFLIR